MQYNKTKRTAFSNHLLTRGRLIVSLIAMGSLFWLLQVTLYEGLSRIGITTDESRFIILAAGLALVTLTAFVGVGLFKRFLERRTSV
jgi:hypothetical protein